MADAKINLSLDEIIKSNKKGGGGKKTGQPQGLAAKRRQTALLRRQKTQQKGAAMGRTPGNKNIRGRGQFRAPLRSGQPSALNAFATRKLVQTLVKKALTQGRVAGRRGTLPLNRTPIRQRIQLTNTLNRTMTGRGRGRGGNIRGRVALRVGGRGRGSGLRLGVRAAPLTTGVKARLGFVAQKNNRLNAVNQRRGLDLPLSTAKVMGRGRGRGRGGFGRLASDQIVQEQNAVRRQQQSIRQQRQAQGQQRRLLTNRGRGGRGAAGGFSTQGFSTQGPRIQLISPSRRMQQQVVSPRGGGRRGRGGAAYFDNPGSSGFGGGEVRGVRASFSNSQTGTTLNDRFGGGRQQVRVGLKQQRGRGGFRGRGRRQIIDY
uniref:UAP56-interacting factor n=1 Tax=Plectus sambesii TaxID=2011161 RepID=A0A914V8L1_9BILA